jgi:hypothetical protein
MGVTQHPDDPTENGGHLENLYRTSRGNHYECIIFLAMSVSFSSVSRVHRDGVHADAHDGDRHFCNRFVSSTKRHE